jgi:CRISPR system Cascade subunit CasA
VPEPYSLLRRPWLPVALDNGHRVFVRPCDISESFEGRWIVHVDTGRPDCDISLTELLIGLLAVSMDEIDEDGWVDRFRAPPSRANRVEALLIDAPGANTIRDNADHFVKRGRTVALSRAGAAAVLATLQTSAPSGGAGHRTSLRGGGPLTTLVLPGLPGNAEPTLWQRLWANVPNGFRARPQELKEVFPWLVPTRVR